MDGPPHPAAWQFLALAGALVILLACSAFFSGTEAAFLSFNRHRLRYLVESGDRRARRVARILEQPDRFLATILVGNNLVNTLAAVLSGVAVHWITADDAIGIPLATVVMTGLLLVFSEITPKVVAATHNETWALRVAPALSTVSVVARPLVIVANASSNFLVRALGVDPRSVGEGITRDELRFLISETRTLGVLRATEGQMLGRVLEFRELTARDLMVPRPDIDAIDASDPPPDVVSAVADSGRSRLPVYRDSIDHISGILYAKDLLAACHRNEPIDVAKVARTAYFVPESKPVGDLLRDFQAREVHMAVVVDDFGGTAGIVTLEDLIEEIVGEIRDEHDEAEPVPARRQDGSWELPAMLRVEQAEELLGVELPDYEVDTLGGFVAAHLHRVPTVGESFDVEGFRFVVAAMKGRRTTSVHVSQPSHRRQKGHHAQ